MTREQIIVAFIQTVHLNWDRGVIPEHEEFGMQLGKALRVPSLARREFARQVTDVILAQPAGVGMDAIAETVADWWMETRS